MDVIVRQVLRCSLSIAANYRSLSRCRSRAEFTSKMNVVWEEADETLFWLEILEELEILPTLELRGECNQLVSIFAASLRTVRRSN